jgi:hypothetical protein
MAKRITITLPADLLNRAKRKAAAEGRTLTSLIEDGLRLVVAGNKKSRERERVMPRVSTAKGGLMPGIDLTNSAALQEMDDLDTIEQMKRAP